MISDTQVRDSKLWKRAGRIVSNLAAAQSAGNQGAATKAWVELNGLFEGTAVEEDTEQAETPMSEARKQLHEAFPDLANIP